ncbi:MAG: flagellar biosynthetic protein FliO [Aestuariivirgaceae bacterium]
MNLEALQQYQQYLTPVAIVLVGLVALWLIAKLVSQKVSGRRGNRLSVSEFHEIDQSRRLVLVRRDDVEHLVMIGGVQDMLIESGIGEKAPVSRSITGLDAVPGPELEAPSSDLDEQQATRIEKILPREPQPAIFGDRAPNLRPAERSEPRFSQDKTGESSA